jgi:hypothetical protein
MSGRPRTTAPADKVDKEDADPLLEDTFVDLSAVLQPPWTQHSSA